MNRQEFIDTLSAKLGKWEAEIRELESKTDTVRAQAREEYVAQMKDLREKQKAAREKIKELQETSEAAFVEVKSGVEQAVATMKESLEAAAEKIK